MSDRKEHTEFLYSLRTGVFRKTSAKRGVKCERCDGRGTEQCAECYGRGTVSKRCKHCRVSHQEKCPKCSGKPAACLGCHGKGKVDLEPELKVHPADVWTIRELRKLSINGSFT